MRLSPFSLVPLVCVAALPAIAQQAVPPVTPPPVVSQAAPESPDPEPSPGAVEGEVADYVRYVEGASINDPDTLQTAVTRFESPDAIVDLVAVVHIADEVYYENLDQLLQGYDVVLYELVGGEFQDREKNAASGQGDMMAGLSGIQSMAGRLLGLVFQLEHVDYASPNFVHADVTWDQYSELMTAKQETLTKLLSRVAELAQAGDLAGVPATEADASEMMNLLLTSILTGDSAGLKRTIAPFLGEAEALIEQIEGEDGTVLVGERNAIVMEKLEEVLAANPEERQRVAIFYGAGHMPDFEERLVADGFTRGETAWANAWTIQDAPVDPDAPSAAQNFFSELTEESPDWLRMIQEFGKALHQAQNP